MYLAKGLEIFSENFDQVILQPRLKIVHPKTYENHNVRGSAYLEIECQRC